MTERGLIGQLLPKTLAGLALWLAIFAAGMAASGVVLFAYYQYRLATIQQEVDSAKDELDEAFETRNKEFQELVKSSKAEIEKAAGGIGSKTNEMTKLLEKVGASVARVEGLDQTGQPAVGSGFIVSSNSNESWVLTSFNVVAGAVAQSQQVTVRLGENERASTVYSWDDQRDLALVILKTGNLPVLEWAKEEAPLGSRIWVVGTAPNRFGATAAEGHILTASNQGLLIDGHVANHDQGGPVLTRDGLVLGVTTLRYAPPGFPPSNGWAVPIRMSCQKVLRCPS